VTSDRLPTVQSRTPARSGTSRTTAVGLLPEELRDQCSFGFSEVVRHRTRSDAQSLSNRLDRASSRQVVIATVERCLESLTLSIRHWGWRLPRGVEFTDLLDGNVDIVGNICDDRFERRRFPHDPCSRRPPGVEDDWRDSQDAIVRECCLELDINLTRFVLDVGVETIVVDRREIRGPDKFRFTDRLAIGLDRADDSKKKDVEVRTRPVPGEQRCLLVAGCLDDERVHVVATLGRLA